METLPIEGLNQLFCMNSKKWGIDKGILKAIAMVESSMQQFAFRYEPDFWANYGPRMIAKFPQLEGMDPKEVSTSYGLMQIMYTTALGLGFDGPGEELYNPVLNIELGARLMNQLWNSLKPEPNFKGWPIEICLARYNGGSYLNPGPDGSLRNYAYTRKVLKAYWQIRSDDAKSKTSCDAT
jgi:hypothetical protein